MRGTRVSVESQAELLEPASKYHAGCALHHAPVVCFVLSAADSSLYPSFVICGSLSKRSLGGQVNSDVWPDTTSEEFQEGIPSQLWWICLWDLFFSFVKAQIGSIRHPFCWKVEQCVSDLKAYNYICTNKLKSVRLCVSCFMYWRWHALWQSDDVWCPLVWLQVGETRHLSPGPSQPSGHLAHAFRKPSHQTGSNQCLCIPIDLVKVGETSIDRTHSNTHTCAHLLHSQTRWTHHSFKGFFNCLCISRASIWISS